MIDSILDTIKKLLGIPSTDTAFDADIVVGINSAIAALHQVGVGLDVTPLVITDNTTEWTALTTDPAIRSMSETYIYLSTKLFFDPPGTSFGIEAFQKLLAELIWRITVVSDPYVPPIL